MVTDPPYGVEYDPSWRNQAGAAKTKRTGKVLNDDRADWGEAWALFPGDVTYVWHGALHATTVAESLVAAGFAVRSQIIWVIRLRARDDLQSRPSVWSRKTPGGPLPLLMACKPLWQARNFGEGVKPFRKVCRLR